MTAGEVGVIRHFQSCVIGHLRDLPIIAAQTVDPLARKFLSVYFFLRRNPENSPCPSLSATLEKIGEKN